VLWLRDVAEASSPGTNGLIAYVKRGPACPAPECGEALWVSALDGTKAKRLKASPTAILAIFYPTWSPDGKMIAYFDYTGGGTPGDPSRPPRYYQLWVINADGSGRRLILDPQPRDSRTLFTRLRPSWTPSGRELVYQTDRATSGNRFVRGGALWAIDVRTKRIRKFAVLPKDVSGSAQLSPHGRHVAYPTLDGDLFVMSSSGSNKRLLARVRSYGFGDSSFDWSPDSKRLAVLSELGPPAIVSLAGGLGPPLVEVQDTWERPVWSPDGSTILSQRQQVAVPDPSRPGYDRSHAEWDRFTTINVSGGGIVVVGPGTGSCSTAGHDWLTKKPMPCKARDPSWQPRR